jgi:hypothetical protein
LVPDQASVAVQDVVLVEDQLNVLLSPAVIEVGLALKFSIGIEAPVPLVRRKR